MSQAYACRLPYQFRVCSGGHVEWRFQRRWRQLVGRALGFVVVGKHGKSGAGLTRGALQPVARPRILASARVRPTRKRSRGCAETPPLRCSFTCTGVWICIKLLTCICIAHRTLRIDSMHYNAAVCIHTQSNNASITLQHAEDNVTWITLGQKSKLFQQADQSQAGRAPPVSEKCS